MIIHNARELFMFWKGQYALPTRDTTCRFAAIFEKPGVARMTRNFRL
jgi:hypothetical protein